MQTDARIAVLTMQEAELNELRATIELLRQQGHAAAQLTPLRRPPPLSLATTTPHRDAQDGQSVVALNKCFKNVKKCLKLMNIWQSYKQEGGCLMHFVCLATTLLKDKES